MRSIPEAHYASGHTGFPRRGENGSGRPAFLLGEAATRVIPGRDPHYYWLMPKAFTEWKPLPHEPIVKLAENVWWVRGSVPGMSLKRVMTVVKLDDGTLAIHSAIALEPDAQAELEAWGEPAFLIVPNAAHRLDAPAYKKRYPKLRVFAPRGARDGVAQVVPVDGTYEDFPPFQSLKLETLAGVGEAEGVLLAHSSDGTTVVLNDAMFNMDRKNDPLGFFFTTLLGSAPGPRVSRLAKLVFIKDKPALRREFERLAAIPDLARVIVAHEKVASGAEARAALLKAATYL